MSPTSLLSGRESDNVLHGGVVSRLAATGRSVEQFLPDPDFEAELAQIFSNNSPDSKGVYVQYACGRERDNRDLNRNDVAQRMNAVVFGTKLLISDGLNTDGFRDELKGQYSPSPGLVGEARSKGGQFHDMPMKKY